MKKIMMMAVLMTAAVSASAQSKPEAYFSFRELPNMLKWCPAPPDTTGAAFTYDIMQYMWGKELRQKDSVRTEIAIRDAVYSLECIAEEFSEPFGLKISEEETPEIWKLLRDAKATCENISGFPKYFYKRKRPFVRFQEHTATPGSSRNCAATSLIPQATRSSAGRQPCCSRRSTRSVPTRSWPVA